MKYSEAISIYYLVTLKTNSMGLKRIITITNYKRSA